MRPPSPVPLQVDSALNSVHGNDPNSRMPKDQPLVQELELNFITITNPDDTRREDHRRYVRTQVLKKYHAKRRSAKQRVSSQMEQPHRPIAPREAEAQTPVSPEVDIVLHRAIGSHKMPGPITYFAAGLVDTFSVLPIALSGNDRYFLDRYIAFAYNLDILIDTPRKKKPLTTCYLPAAMKDPITLNSMLLTGAQCFEKSNHSQTVYQKAQYYASYYRGRLLQSINQALSDKEKAISDSVIAGLVKLETDEYLEGNREQFDLHATALRTIIGLSGGLQTLGMQGFLADLVLRVDQAAASYFASQPYFPQPLPPKICVSIEALNTGFFSQPILSNLSEEVISLLNDVCAITNAMNNANGDLPESGPVSWEAAGECEKSLMILCAQRKSAVPTLDLPDIQECTCLAAELYWMRVVRNYSVSTYGGPLTSKDLLDSLNRLLSTGKHQEFFHGQFLELLLWTAFMGSLAIDTPEGVREWTEMISRIALKLGIRTWDQVKPILHTFLWLESRSEMLSKSTWGQVEDLMFI